MSEVLPAIVIARFKDADGVDILRGFADDAWFGRDEFAGDVEFGSERTREVNEFIGPAEHSRWRCWQALEVGEDLALECVWVCEDGGVVVCEVKTHRVGGVLRC